MRLNTRFVGLTLSAFLFMAGIYNFFPFQHTAQAATDTVLRVDATATVNPFTSENTGMALVNWEHLWGRPEPSKVPHLAELFKAANVGVIRYGGGLWANGVGWDPTTNHNNGSWSKNGNTYDHEYHVEEIDSVGEFANEIGAKVMIQVNVEDNDPAMWADMLKFYNKSGRKDTKGRPYYFKYWELGNEFDIAKTLTPAQYADRVKAYQDALLAVDPSIEIVGGVAGTAIPDDATTLDGHIKAALNAAKANNKPLGSVSYHWYQQCNTTNQVTDIMRYRYYNSDGTPMNPDLGRNHYSRYWATYMPARMDRELANYSTKRQGITELNADACNYDNVVNGNHIGAVWFSDVLGRLAYNGLDYVTAYVGYNTQGYGLTYPNYTDQWQTVFGSIHIRPTYYAFIMYSKYFGDTMVKSQSYDDNTISVWASKYSTQPNKLSIMVVNTSGSSITAPVQTDGFTATKANVYVMKSTNPTDMSSTSNQDSANTTINGVKLDPNNINTSISSIQPVPLTISANTFNYTFPAYSTTVFILDGTSGTGPTSAPTPTPVVSVTKAPTVAPTKTPTVTVTKAPTATPTKAVATPVPGAFSSKATVSPTSVNRGSTVTITNTFTVPTAGNYLVDVEIYNSAGAKINQQFFDNQAFTAGQTRTYTTTWAVPATQGTGTYTVRQGIFAAGWGGVKHWNANAATFSVAALAPTATPTKVPTPTVSAVKTNLRIVAAGTIAQNAYPLIRLKLKGVQATANGAVWEKYVTGTLANYDYVYNGSLTAKDIRVEFVNDLGYNYQNRDLRVDKIYLNGVAYETEASTIYMTGGWTSTTGCSAGYFKSEWINCGGYIQY